MYFLLGVDEFRIYGALDRHCIRFAMCDYSFQLHYLCILILQIIHDVGHVNPYTILIFILG